MWAILLSLMLVFGQGTKLHVHEVEHHGQDDRGAMVLNSSTDQSHVNGVHPTADRSHEDHHGGHITELDAISDVLLKVTSSILAAALLVAAFFWVPRIVSRRVPFRISSDVRIPLFRYHLVRFSRAPPL